MRALRFRVFGVVDMLVSSFATPWCEMECNLLRFTIRGVRQRGKSDVLCDRLPD